jgi:hypothetical protein
MSFLSQKLLKLRSSKETNPYKFPTFMFYNYSPQSSTSFKQQQLKYRLFYEGQKS